MVTRNTNKCRLNLNAYHTLSMLNSLTYRLYSLIYINNCTFSNSVTVSQSNSNDIDICSIYFANNHSYFGCSYIQTNDDIFFGQTMAPPLKCYGLSQE